MPRTMQSGLAYGKALWKEVQDDDFTGKSAQIAYHLLFSIIPLLIFLTALSSFISQQIGIDDAMNDITAWLRERLPLETQAAVIDPIEETLSTAAGGLLSFGAITALWSGKNALGSVIQVLNGIFEVKDSRPWWKKQVVAIALTILLGLAAIAGSAAILLSSTVGSDIAERVGLGGFWSSTWRWVQFPLIAAVLVLVVATVFWRGPDAKVTFRQMLPGAIATVVLWVIAVVALSIYFARFAGYLGGAYGALGGVMAFVFFLYVMTFVLLLGGQIAAFAGQRSTQREPTAAQRSWVTKSTA